MRRLTGAVAVALAMAGCGGGGEDEDRPRLKVSAAASLKVAFEDYGRRLEGADARFSFAGSDELAAQISRGVRPDVYAAANTKLPDRLHRQGRLERSVAFAANRLVVAVPAAGRRVSSLADLERPGVRLAVGAPTVPVGSYTREVLARLGRARAGQVLANVRSNEPDVGGVVAKVAQGAADAGFVYASDVRAAGGRLRSLALPDRLQPRVVYGVGVVRGARHPLEAREFVRGLLRGPGRRSLARAGFEPPPPRR